MHLTRILLVLTALALFGACNDATPPDPPQNDITGLVVDDLGQPVAGATVVLQLNTDPSIYESPDKPQTQIEWELPEPCEMRVWISSYCDGDVLRLLMDGLLPAGVHMLTWDGTNEAGLVLPDGIYRYHLVTETGESTVAFPILHHGYGSFDAETALAPQATTDAQGRFRLDQTCLPFGFAFDSIDDSGEPISMITITRIVRVWAFSGDAYGTSHSVTVDSDAGANVTVTMIQ